MFLNELKPIVREVTKEPLAFCSGFVSGLLRIKIDDDPLKSWLEKQGINVSTPNSDQNRDREPQSIDIE
jgi:hypothetical protein